MSKFFWRAGEDEIRYYKGKYRVQILVKSRMNYLVKALEEIISLGGFGTQMVICKKGGRFTTSPRLLWRHPRK